MACRRATSPYRVVATNAAGVARGRDRTFTTQRNPRAITASASPNPAPWSGSTTVSGRVTGRGVGGTTVALERQDFPFAGPFYLVVLPRDHFAHVRGTSRERRIRH